MEVISQGSLWSPTTVDLEAGPGLGRDRPCNETAMSDFYSLSALTAYPDAVNGTYVQG